MTKTSWFIFKGDLLPSGAIAPGNISFSLNRYKGSVSLEVNGTSITIRLIAIWDSFEDLYAETKEFVQSFLAAQALQTGVPLQLVITEWIENPLETPDKESQAKPVRGRVFHEPPISSPIPVETLAHGMEWVEDMEWSPFLRRAVIDFNYALQHPVNDVPIYLSRAIESAEAFFGGELPLIDSLNVRTQVKLVKRLANDRDAGIHARHAATTPIQKTISAQEVIQAVRSTKEIIDKFRMVVLGQRIKSQQSPQNL
jgi:hypothetical protein